MKANRITLIAQTIGMYIMHLPLYIFFIIELLSVGGDMENLVSTVLTSTIVLTSVVALICIANIVLSVISIVKGGTDLSKTVKKVKLALIPWYVLNFAMCAIMVLLMFNPFTMLGIPMVIAFAMGLTYFLMLGTSLPNVAYYLRRVFVNKEEKLTKPRVITIVLHFIFCLDVIGGIVFHRQNKKAIPSDTERENAAGDVSEGE